jgi:Raf kinase inhibitor-like YbhB/YbcL family protein
MGRDTSLRERTRTFDVTSAAFGHGQRMPIECTEDGSNRSPDLEWPPGPEGCGSFALICDDPNAPTNEPFTHWVIFDIPGSATGLPDGVSWDARPPEVKGAAQGTNSFGHLGYDGPAPPPGHGTHHYHFKVYALDGILDLQAGCTKADVLRALKGRVLSKGELVGTYSR